MSQHLSIFLSYASEDAQFATLIADRLDRAFKRSIELKYMSQFPMGANFRALIDQSLDDCDILLVIATGHEKLSHTFTGYEVGYFRRSQQTRPCIADTKTERLIIPFAMFADIPDTISDIQGIKIAETDRLVFTRDLLFSRTDTNKPDPFLTLLTRVDEIVDRLDPVDRDSQKRSADYDGYRDQAQAFYRDLVKVLNTLPLRREFPKTRLSLRLPVDFRPREADLEEGVRFSCHGPTMGIFDGEMGEQWLSWSELAQRLGSEETGWSWKDALKSLIDHAISGDFSNSDQLVFSFDSRRLFRLFVAKSTTFFDQTRELDIYLVEVRREPDIGDPFTTFLAKALAIALRYRSLFLEASSPYGPIALRFTPKEDWKRTVREVLRELRLLLLQSREAGLGERRHVIELYGAEDSAVDAAVSSMNSWVEQKAKMYLAAARLLRDPDVTEEEFEEFLGVLGVFCERTKEMNTVFTNRIVERLREELEKA